MCATYKINVTDQEMQEIIDAVERGHGPGAVASGDIYPKSMAPVLCLDKGAPTYRPMMWGLPLSGKKSVNFNARAENIDRYAMFRKGRPILIPVSGFYEWGREGNSRVRYYFRNPDGLTWIAGLASDCSQFDDGLYPERFTMITRAPSEDFRMYHDRQPAILDKDTGHVWLAERSSRLLDRMPYTLEVEKIVGAVPS